MAKQIEVRGFEELAKRFKAYPMKFAKVMSKTMVTALLVLQEKIPPYPPAPTGSGYRRTGTLGRSLGISITSGRIGQPDIFTVKKMGGGNLSGKIGTRLGYASKVIGDRSQQFSFFAQYWWRLEQVVGKAFPKILSVYNTAMDALAKFLEGKGL